MDWARDEKRGRRAMETTREKDERKTCKKMVGQSEDGFKDCRSIKCTTVLHGGVCHYISTTPKSGNKMKKK